MATRRAVSFLTLIINYFALHDTLARVRSKLLWSIPPNSCLLWCVESRSLRFFFHVWIYPRTATCSHPVSVSPPKDRDMLTRYYVSTREVSTRRGYLPTEQVFNPQLLRRGLPPPRGKQLRVTVLRVTTTFIYYSINLISFCLSFLICLF